MPHEKRPAIDLARGRRRSSGAGGEGRARAINLDPQTPQSGRLFGQKLQGFDKLSQFSNASAVATTLNRAAPAVSGNTTPFRQLIRDAGLRNARNQTVLSFQLKRQALNDEARAQEAHEKRIGDMARLTLASDRNALDRELGFERLRTQGLEDEANREIRQQAIDLDRTQGLATQELRQSALDLDRDRFDTQTERDVRRDELAERKFEADTASGQRRATDDAVDDQVKLEKSFTPESVAEFQATGNRSALKDRANRFPNRVLTAAQKDGIDRKQFRKGDLLEGEISIDSFFSEIDRLSGSADFADAKPQELRLQAAENLGATLTPGGTEKLSGLQEKRKESAANELATSFEAAERVFNERAPGLTDQEKRDIFNQASARGKTIEEAIDRAIELGILE